MNKTHQKGEIAELKFQLECVNKNYTLSKSPQDCAYDYVLDKNNSLYRVQVKYRSFTKNKTVSISCVNSNKYNNRIYNKNSVDLFAIYISNIDKIALIPISCFNKSRTIFRFENKNINSNNITKYLNW